MNIHCGAPERKEIRQRDLSATSALSDEEADGSLQINLLRIYFREDYRNGVPEKFRLKYFPSKVGALIDW